MDTSVKTKIDKNKSFTKQFYSSKKYNTLSRLLNYAIQIHEIIDLEPDNTLEIGIGNGFVKNALKHLGYRVTTLDNNTELEPDIVGNVNRLPFRNNEFDLIACFEVLEHMQYIDFEKSLQELKRVSKNNILISIPDASYKLKFDMPLVKKLIILPFRRSIPVTRSHFWEVNSKGYPLAKILKSINNVGLNVRKNYLPGNNSRLRYFLLSVNK